MLESYVEIKGKKIKVSKVSSIKEVGIKRVYDFEVKDDHNYYAQGISVHNCRYHQLLKQYEHKYGQEFLKFKDTFILYRHRNFLIYPASPDLRVLRGRTRILGAIDEIGWFDNNKDNKKVKMNATGVYVAVQNSLVTIRSKEKRLIDQGYDEAMTGYMFNVSSPSSIRDKICELVKLSQGSKKLLGLHLPTWLMNPDIPKEALSEEFRKDPVAALRDFGAEPPLTSNPFIGSQDMVRQLIRTKGRNLVSYDFRIHHNTKDGTKYRWAEINKIKGTTRKSVMALDAGYSNNSFGLVVGSVDPDTKTLSADLLIEINPLPGIVLNFSLLFEHIMKPVIEARNVKILLADRWNSLKILQDAEIHTKIEMAKQYSLKYSDFWDLKVTMEQGQVSIPRAGSDIKDILQYNPDGYPRCFEKLPAEHLILQMLTVQDSGSGIVKGDNLTDDIFRAMALMIWGLQNPDYQELLQGTEENTVRPSALGVSRLGSGTSTKSIASAGRKTLGTTKSRN